MKKRKACIRKILCIFKYILNTCKILSMSRTLKVYTEFVILFYAFLFFYYSKLATGQLLSEFYKSFGIVFS